MAVERFAPLDGRVVELESRFQTPSRLDELALPEGDASEHPVAHHQVRWVTVDP